MNLFLEFLYASQYYCLLKVKQKKKNEFINNGISQRLAHFDIHERISERKNVLNIREVKRAIA